MNAATRTAWRGRLASWRKQAAPTLRDDLLAACAVSVLLIPQSLAYAHLAGLPPQTGLYASLLPLLAYAALGSSPLLAVGPVALLALMTAQALSHAPAGFTPEAAALVLAAETGLILALAALLRLHALAALLSVPVLQGVETGAALSIALGQIPALLGLPLPHFPPWPRGFLEALHHTGQWLGQAHGPTTLFGGLALLTLWGLRRYAAEGNAPTRPLHRTTVLARLAPLAVLLLSIAIAARTDAAGYGVALLGPLPPLSLHATQPPWDAALWRALWPHALLLALVAFVSSLAVAESLGRRQGQRIVPRRELAGLAGANLAAAFSGGMPVAGSFSRSVLVMDAGSRSRMAGVFTAGVLGLVVWLLAEPLAWLPKAVLAASIMVAVLGVVRWQPFVDAWRYARPEGLLMVAVALLALTGGISWALGVGVAASIALLLQGTARPHVALIGRVGDSEHFRNVDRFHTRLTPGVLSLRIDESLLFTNARQLVDVVLQQLAEYGAAHPDTRRVVLLMSPVNHIDFSGLAALQELHDLLLSRGLRLDLSEVKGPVLDALRASAWERWFRGNVYLSHHQAMLDNAEDKP